MAPPPDALFVFVLLAVTVALFVTEAIPADTTAIGVVVALVVFEPVTRVAPVEALSGFSNPATITIVAMYILSGGIERTGIVHVLGRQIAARVGGNRRRLLGATIGVTGPLAGVINNTPVVAVLIPMVIDLANRSHVSPSRLLLPLSYAAMLGGMLTLIGTATNLVASDLSAQLLDHPFSMFEFTPLGVVVLAVGSAYLLTVGQWLIPERIPAVDLTERFGLRDYLWRVYVRQGSPLIGETVEEVFDEHDLNLDILQIVRGPESFVAPGTDQGIRIQDVLTVRGDEATVREFVDRNRLRLLPRTNITEAELDRPGGRGRLVEAVVPTGSALIGRTIAEAALRERYRATVLAVRRGGELLRGGLAGLTLLEGDGLLLHATRRTTDLLGDELLVTQVSTGPETPAQPPAVGRASLAVAIVAGVIIVAALGLLPIAIAALGGVVAMVVTRVINPGQAYDAVHWDVIFLLAGLIPLGLALQRTGGAAFLAGLLVGSASVLPPLAVLGLIYLLTGLLSNVVTPVATVVVMLPVAVDAAARIGANGFAFALAVTFAASTAFMTPVGYQTNLMVYSPGGYRFTDYIRVGAPLQLLLAVVTTVGIDLFWGVT